jgi:hypothetical protein
MINKHVGPVLRVDTKGGPFNMAVKAAYRIAIAGKVYSVANPAAIEICGRLCRMLGEIARRMRFSGIGPLVGTASRKQYQSKKRYYRLPNKDVKKLLGKQISHDIQHKFSMILDFRGNGSRKWDQVCRQSCADSGSPPDGASCGSSESGS